MADDPKQMLMMRISRSDFKHENHRLKSWERINRTQFIKSSGAEISSWSTLIPPLIFGDFWWLFLPLFNVSVDSSLKRWRPYWLSWSFNKQNERIKSSWASAGCLRFRPERAAFPIRRLQPIKTRSTTFPCLSLILPPRIPNESLTILEDHRQSLKISTRNIAQRVLLSFTRNNDESGPKMSRLQKPPQKCVNYHRTVVDPLTFVGRSVTRAKASVNRANGGSGRMTEDEQSGLCADGWRPNSDRNRETKPIFFEWKMSLNESSEMKQPVSGIHQNSD